MYEIIATYREHTFSLGLRTNHAQYPGHHLEFKKKKKNK